AVEKQGQRNAEMQQSDLYAGPDNRLMEENNRWYANTNAWRTLVTAYSKTGKITEARDVLAKWEAALPERRKRAEEIRRKRDAEKPEAVRAARPGQGPDRSRSMEDSVVRSMPMAELQYYDALAQLALAEKRKLDALAFYQSGLRAMAGAAGSSPNLAKSEAGRKASDLWKALA